MALEDGVFGPKAKNDGIYEGDVGDASEAPGNRRFVLLPPIVKP